jgi:hypothetical protein
MSSVTVDAAGVTVRVVVSVSVKLDAASVMSSVTVDAAGVTVRVVVSVSVKLDAASVMSSVTVDAAGVTVVVAVSVSVKLAVVVAVTVETEVMVLAAGHVEVGAHEALDTTVTVDAKPVTVVVARQLEGVVEELVDDLDVDEVTVAATMHEQPELNFEGDALQAARKVGKPVVAV